MTFHWRNGWTFERTADGTVMVAKSGAVHLEIPPAEWASIVASVTGRGETAATYQEATHLHQTCPCERCRGCGQVADSDAQEPWIDWQELPVMSAMAVTLGLIKLIPCPTCGGAGEVCHERD